MSKLTERDKEIQQFLEQGLKTEANNSELSSADLDTYRMVFEALDKKPAEGLPYQFASKVVAEIQSRESLQFSFKSQVLVPALLIIAAMAFYVFISFVDESLAAKISHLVVTYKWFAAFGISSYLVVEYLNYRMLGKR